MKKSTIGVIIAAVIMVIVGGGLFVGGIIAVGGVATARGMIDGRHGIFDLHWDEDGFYITKNSEASNFSDKKNQEHHIEETYEEANHAERTVGNEVQNYSDMEPLTFKMEEVESLYLEVNEAEVEFGGSSNQEISIRTDGNYESYVRNKVLYIKPKGIQKEHKMLINLPNVQVPGEILFKEAEIHAGASKVYISQISAKEFELEVGAGQVTINRLVAEHSEFDIGAGEVIVEYGNVQECENNVDMGNFEYTGLILKHGDVECNLGNAAYHLEREVDEYNYEIECGAGNVDIGNESFSGLGREKYIDHHVQESFDIECNVGNVSIDTM